MSEESNMIEITEPNPTGHRMPVDFATYLLSSSPPASSLELLSYAFSPDNDRHRSPASEPMHGFVYHQSRNLNSLSQRRNAPLKPIIIKPEVSTESSDSSGFSSASGSCASGDSTPTSPQSPGKLKKKVSFADHKGKALATVRVITEPSDMPPRLRPEVLATVTQGAIAGVSEQPPLKLCFSQPASEYMAFRDKLEKECVSLENVILRDYNVAGTIKVKNMTFEKRVFVRCTFDSWESFEDIQAVYIPGPGASNVYDTFSFEFHVPTNFDMGKVIEFVVCFESDNNQYWDNNGGKNYHIVSADYKKKEEPVLVTSRNSTSLHSSSWPTFACWNNVDTSTPYW